MLSLARKIKDLRLHLDLTQGELGERLDGVPQATVSKWENGKQEPDGENSLKLAALAGVEPHVWMNMPKMGESVMRHTRVPIVGACQAGAWHETVSYPEIDQRLVEAPIPDMIEGRPTSALDIKAFEVDGTSMNRVYPQGTIVYAASPTGFRKPENDDRVVVVRKNDDGMLEVTLKELVVEGDGRKWLFPRSHDPEFQAPLPYVQSSENVVIIGIVIAALVIEAGRKTRK